MKKEEILRKHTDSRSRVFNQVGDIRQRHSVSNSGLTPMVKKITLANITNKRGINENKFITSHLTESDESSREFGEPVVRKVPFMEESQDPYYGLDVDNRIVQSEILEQSQTMPPLEIPDEVDNKIAGDNLYEAVQHGQELDIVTNVGDDAKTLKIRKEDPDDIGPNLEISSKCTKISIPVNHEKKTQKLVDSNIGCPISHILGSDYYSVSDTEANEEDTKKKKACGELQRKRGLESTNDDKIIVHGVKRSKTCEACKEEMKRGESDALIMVMQLQINEMRKEFHLRTEKVNDKCKELERRLDRAQLVFKP